MTTEKETLALIGMTEDELRDRVVKAIADRVLSDEHTDEDGRTYPLQSVFRKELDEHVIKTIDDTVAGIAEAHVMPDVKWRIEHVVLQETNRWGEAKGEALTFTEYLVHRADSYMKEEVDYNGKPRGKDSYSWKGSGTRIEHMISEHLQWSISVAMKDALKDANKSIAGGIEKAIKMKLEELLEGINCSVKVKG